MENKKWDNCRRSQKGKPPRGIWRPAVPSWEKKFCKEIGLVKWEALIKAKKDIHLYGNVMNWDDSAAKEAFFDAKNRYWAKINGLPCDDVPLPDPDLYIDKDINDDVDDDDDHLAEKTLFSSSSSSPVIIFGDSHHQYQTSGFGWGEEFKAQPNNQFSSPNYAAAAAVHAKGNSSSTHGFNQTAIGWRRDKFVLGQGGGKTALRREEGNAQLSAPRPKLN